MFRASDIAELIARNETRRAVVPITTPPAASLPENWWNTDFWADADLTAAGRGRR